jgi:hypothetical protein
VPTQGTQSAIQAGVWWDAIRVPQERGHRALSALRTSGTRPPGPVVADPHRAEPCLYFLVPRTTAKHWNAPGTRALGQSCYVVVPDAGRTEPPGLHWAVPPATDVPLTSPHELREALDAAAEHA